VTDQAGLAIGDVAARAGVEPSAIRYYESIGLLPKPSRAGGKRRYGDDVLDRLSLISLAKNAGFTMQEIRQLVADVSPGSGPAERWRVLATRKIAELDESAERLRRMRKVLRRALECGCVDLEACGPMLRAGFRR
jgi:MerR family transcriptional regulator, redox-sensitive transcriptional activator SoxR